MNRLYLENDKIQNQLGNNCFVFISETEDNILSLALLLSFSSYLKNTRNKSVVILDAVGDTHERLDIEVIPIMDTIIQDYLKTETFSESFKLIPSIKIEDQYFEYIYGINSRTSDLVRGNFAYELSKKLADQFNKDEKFLITNLGYSKKRISTVSKWD
jgi:hypothetical protein